MKPIHAYVGCRTTRERNARGRGISVYTVDPVRQLWELTDICQAPENPSFLALNARQDVLYAVHGDGNDLSSYHVDHSSGRLSLLNRQSCEGRNPVHLGFSRDGASLIVANYATGTVARLSVGAEGELAPVSSLVTLPGAPGPHRSEQAGSHPHQVSRYATRRYNTNWHIVPDKGLDTVFAIQWLETGEPRVVGHRCRSGAGPRHAAFHPTLPLVYVANELDSTITVWSFDVFTGALEPLHTVSVIPSSAHGDTSVAGVAIDPAGRSLYVSNRGHDSVATLPLDGTSGIPGQPRWTDAHGNFPRFISLDPSGTYLYVANERSDNIVQYALDKTSGMPSPTGQTVHTGSPVCIVFKTIQE
ncbi:lactonase family protein [Paraburkholderia panacisoli]|uniref:Lactonase family protein n=1 Tax=Paraburkholderia panacisoli TaxID=2603818 RepID=A0A5B0GNC3_9BURK|nr:beta-propeller fold lactonase family protein [Paraburkholderia panacisoli]KAA1004906.1 lactonase family protein [Paraburkholderia panacisoli]